MSPLVRPPPSEVIGGKCPGRADLAGPTRGAVRPELINCTR